MKAEQRKEIETNSLVLAVQKMRQRASGRGLYYVIGTIALVIAAILLYRYFAGERTKARDAKLLQLASADTPEKLKQGMEEYRGELLGSLFKMHLARHHLRNEGIPRLATDRIEPRKQAAASIEQARTYFLELTGEFKDKEEPGLEQEAWIGAAEAEEALVGLPKAENESEFRGNVDKAIQYNENAAAIFPDTDFSKRYKTWAEKIKANKDQFVADQKATYKPTPSLFTPPDAKAGPLGPIVPPIPKGDGPTLPLGPPIPSLPEAPDPKGGTDPKPPEPPKASNTAKEPEPKAKPADPKNIPEPSKGNDPKAK